MTKKATDYRCPDCGTVAVGRGAPLCECGKMMVEDWTKGE